ncbi:MAG TPA: HlyD family efflux transporter periplasmic adaptor subunit, partial [Bradyrhizobium sp.]|nr:HlyD family efflux transporter periplasmic adaptor subunit [Bradyrhizobium sp.]
MPNEDVDLGDRSQATEPLAAGLKGALTTATKPPQAVRPPAAIRRPSKRPSLKRGLLIFALLLASGAVGYYAWLHGRPALPPGIASGNGRLEADEIDIETKFPGRIARLFADEGDMVKAGQALALMDTQDLEASLRKSEALVQQAQRSIDAAKATLAQQKTQVLLAQQEIARTRSLVDKGFATRETLDQRQQQLDGALSGRDAAASAVGEAEEALNAASHDVELYKVNIADNTLVAPRDGRIQYRVANVGEVLPSGGKVFTMLDTGYVYMDIYLPTAEAGRIKLGSDARIVLDAYPTHAIPAAVAFIASQAQFTPKT